MKTFTDSQGRTWTVVVNVSAIKRVRDLLQVDLLDVANGELLSRLADDPVLLVDVLYALVKPEADAQNVTDEDFGRALVGGVLDEAASALMKDLLDFFPSAQRARALGKMVRKIKEQEAALAEALEAVASISGDSSGNSPAEPALTPDP
ncbi:MAG TPA: hypothetical protein VMY69_01890 [Phycisphaerae bacterium]|nr:hypothetical protein [Phycisphaerae bacterium]